MRTSFKERPRPDDAATVYACIFFTDSGTCLLKVLAESPLEARFQFLSLAQRQNACCATLDVRSNFMPNQSLLILAVVSVQLKSTFALHALHCRVSSMNMAVCLG